MVLTLSKSSHFIHVHYYGRSVLVSSNHSVCFILTRMSYLMNAFKKERHSFLQINLNPTHLIKSTEYYIYFSHSGTDTKENNAFRQVASEKGDVDNLFYLLCDQK